MSDLPPPPPPPSDAVAGAVGVAPAPLGRRFGAIVIDIVLSSAVAIGLVLAAANAFSALPNDSGERIGNTVGNPGQLLILALIVSAAFGIWSFVLWGWGTTPGKKFLGLQVVDARTGTVVGFGRMFLREAISKGLLGSMLSGIPVVIGIIMILVVPKRRSYWDMIAGTVVATRE